MRFGLALDGVCVLSCYGNQGIVFARLKSRISNRVSRHRELCGGLQGEQYDHCRFYPRNLGRYSYLFQIRPSQRHDIQGFENPFAELGLIPPSNLGEVPLCRERGFSCQLPRTWLLLRAMVGVLWVYLLGLMKSLVSFLVGKVFPLMLASLYEKQKSLPLPLVSKQDYQSYSFRLNQVVSPYLILPQTGVGCKP